MEYKDETLIGYLDDCFKQLADEREEQDWNSHWAELRRFILPRSGQNDLKQWYSTDDNWNINYGGGLNNDIVNGVATNSVTIISSGLMSGITNPTMKWFALELPEQEVGETDEKMWLSKLEKTLRDIYLRSNLYNILPRIYEDLAVYGTAALGVFDHPELDLRFEHYPIGTYWISDDNEYKINTFFRKQARTAQNIVKEFCYTTDGKFSKKKFNLLSEQCKRAYTDGDKTMRFDIVEFIGPMDKRKFSDGQKLMHKYRNPRTGQEEDFPFVHVIYERSGDDIDYMGHSKILHKGGYHMFPILVPRWYPMNYDIYGRSPCMDVLPMVKMLQGMEKTKHVALQKHVAPPLQTSGELANPNVDTSADAVNAVVEVGVGSKQGIMPIYDVKPDLSHFTNDIEKMEYKIRTMLMTDLFHAISNIEKSNVTATEVIARQNEKFLQLGPVMINLEEDLLRPLVDISVYRAQTRGLIEDAPESLHGTTFTPKYISIVAMAMMGKSRETLTLYENLISDLAVRQANLGQSELVTDYLKYGEIVRAYEKQFGIDPAITRSDREVKKMRDERVRRQQEAAQAAMQAQAQQMAPLDAPDTPTAPPVPSALSGGKIEF